MALLLTLDTSTGDALALILTVGAFLIGMILMLLGWIDRVLSKQRPNAAADLLSSRAAAADPDPRGDNGVYGSTKGYTGAPHSTDTQAAHSTHTEARDIIRFERAVEVVTALYDAGMFDSLTKAVELGFQCSRQSEKYPESTYQRALREIKARSQRWHEEQATAAPAAKVPEPARPLVFNGIEKIPMTYPVSRADEAT